MWSMSGQTDDWVVSRRVPMKLTTRKLRHGVSPASAIHGSLMACATAILLCQGTAAAADSWIARYAGGMGSGRDYLTDLAVDAAGNRYLAGRNGEGYVTVKYGPDGSEKWRALFAEGDTFVSIAVNERGEVYVAGSFLVKYSPTGEELWNVRTALFARWSSVRVVLDPDGNVLVSGRPSATTVKYDPDGNELWRAVYPVRAKKWKGPDLRLDASRNAYVFTRGLVVVKYDNLGRQLWEREIPSVKHWELGSDGALYIVRGQFLAKYGADGNVLWEKELLPPTSGLESLNLDMDGNIYLLGATFGEPDGPRSFVAKYDPAGTRLWLFRGQHPEELLWRAQAIDPEENVYYVAKTRSREPELGAVVTVKVSAAGVELWRSPLETPIVRTLRLAVTPDGEAFLAGSEAGDFLGVNFAPDGSESWRVRLDTTVKRRDSPAKVIVDGSGSVYVLGQSQDEVSCQPVLMKYDPEGRELWTAHPEDACRARELAVDGEGHVIVAGGGATTKYDSEGEQLWTIPGLREREIPAAIPRPQRSAIFVDANGDVYVTGAREGALVTTKYDSEANEVWTRQSEGVGGFPVVSRMTTDASGNVYVAGASGNLVFVVKYGPDGEEIWKRRSRGKSGVVVDALSVDDVGRVHVGGTFEPKSSTGPERVTLRFTYSADGREVSTSRIWGFEARSVEIDGQGTTYVVGSHEGDMLTWKDAGHPGDGEIPVDVSLEGPVIQTAEGALEPEYEWSPRALGNDRRASMTLTEPGRYLVSLSLSSPSLSVRKSWLVRALCSTGDTGPWTVTNLGEPSYPGCAHFEGGKEQALKLCGAGGVPHRFPEDALFVHRELPGNFSLVARVTDLQRPRVVARSVPGSRVGLMFRGGLGPGSPFAGVFFEDAEGGQVVFRYRRLRQAIRAKAVPQTLPAWIQLTRQGDTFTGLVSSDGEDWVEVDRWSVALPETSFGGVVAAGSDHATEYTYYPLNARIEGLEALPGPAPRFIRGDCNGDVAIDISDAVSGLMFLFGDTDGLRCREACDSNGDSAHDITDPIYLLIHLLRGGSQPPAPFPSCSVDPDEESSLGCVGTSCD